MKNSNVPERMEELIQELNRHSHNYYVLDNPTIADREYDKLYDELVELEQKTGIVLPYSPTVRVGDKVLKGFKKYTHKAKLWSLGKSQSKEELIEWHNRNKKLRDEYNNTHEDQLAPLAYVVTKKFDGLTVNATYDEDGIFTVAATRGTGEIGEDVTANVRTIKSLPLKIDNNHMFEIHGEAIMTEEAFEAYNKTTDVPLKNLRNGAAGALRNLNIQETARRNLSAFFYDVGYNEGPGFETYMEMLSFIREKGFPIDDYAKYCTNIDEVFEACTEIEKMRADLNYDIDGAVIVIDDIKTRDVFGYTVKFPRWAIALKFEAEEATTTLLDVEWNIGRSGRVAPTAILEPIEFGGVTVKRATLNNMDDIKRKGVSIGSRVFVRRSNDVIPEIMGVAEEGGNTKEILPPEVCPYCATELILDGAHYFCENSLSCKPQLVKSVVHFAGREAMNIPGFSSKTAEQLFEKLDMKSISDLYKLTKEDLLTLDKFGDKKADNLLNAIEGSKKPKLYQFVYAMGIPNVGLKTAKDLCKRFNSLEKLENAKIEELIEIDDVGEIVAKCLVDFFSEEHIKESLLELLNVGIEPIYEEIEVVESSFLGKTIVVTGTLQNFTRTSIKEKIESLGAKPSTSVSKKTDYLLYGENAGSKYNKAVELGVETISEEEFIKLIEV